jgi:predicted permease
MRLWHEVMERLRALLFRAREEREMAKELAFHIEMETEKNVRSGMSPSEAGRKAQIEFGGAEQIKEDVRAARGIGWIEHAARDVRHAWRNILRMPALALVVIVSLGVGIGVNTAIFSWIQAVVLKPIPGVEDSGSFYLIEPRNDEAVSAHAAAAGRAAPSASGSIHPQPPRHVLPSPAARAQQRGGMFMGMSWLEYRDLREHLQSFDGLIAFRMVPFNVGESGRAVRAYGQLVSGNYFTALRLRPALGRFLTEQEATRIGGEAVIVISHDFWQTRFAGAAHVLGQILRVNDRELTIVGVAPRGFQGTILGLNFDLWVPATLAPVLLSGSRELQDRGNRGYSAIGRLRAGITLEHAQAEVDGAMAHLAQIYPASNATVRADVLTYWRAPRGPQQFLLPALAVLQGIMLLLLLAVCANTANLILARATVRQREIAVRRALGASRWRIVSLLLTESLVLALLGAGLGIAIAVWGTNALRAGPIITAFPIKYYTSVDGVGLTVAILLGLVCGLAFGVGPALQLLRGKAQYALRSGASTTTRSPLRNALMGIEVALALVVLVAAAIFLENFGETRDTDAGFQREGVVLASYDFTGRSLTEEETRTFAATLLQRLQSVPGVEAAAIARMVPLDIHGMPMRTFTLEGRARDDASLDQSLINIVTPGYFATMGIPLLAGRDFTDLTDRTTAPQAIVNQEFVNRYLGAAEALGRKIRAGDLEYTIAAVVSTSLYNSFSEEPTPIVYFSYRDRAAWAGEIHVRTRPGSELSLIPEIRRVVREVDPQLPIYDARTLNEHVDKNLVFRRIPARMFVVLGPLLLILAAIGIYAVVAFSVSRRTPEIGLRLALGAPARRVVTQIMRESLRVVAIGAAIGWFIAFMVYIHLAAGQPLDPTAFLGVPALLVLVAAIASWIPARRASRVDPMMTLRQE